MAFPAVLAVVTDKSGGTGAGTNRVHDIPASSAGNLLLLQLGELGTGAIGLPAGWTVVTNVTSSHTTGFSERTIIVVRQADGTAGTTFSFTTEGNNKVATICYRITGHEDPAVQLPEVSSVVTNPSGQQTSSADLPALTPTGGAKDYLWFGIITISSNGAATITAPPNYTDMIQQDSSFQGSGGRTGSARRERNAATEDPGAFSISTGVDWHAFTLVVHPAPAPPPSAALSGTVTDPTNEGDIRNGGRTIILTLTNGNWVAAGASFDAQRQGIIDGITALVFQANGWNDLVIPAIPVGNVVRTSDTVVTITLPAVPGYNPAQDEVVRAVIPLTAAGAGWNEAVLPAIPLANVVRTSDTVVTISLPSVAGYAIEADEEMTATIPAAAFNADNPDFDDDPVVASPTFTVSNQEGDEILADPSFTILALPEATGGPVASQQRLLLVG